MENQLVPAKESRAEIGVANSRFIASLAPTFSVEAAKGFIAQIKAEFADATHNVSAFVIGHGSSTIAHSNDDGEPRGTAGRPALSVLRGSGLGDTAVVVTRYFGGTKLGRGGLVRAYGEAVRAVLKVTPRAKKVPTTTVMIALPYSFYESFLKLVGIHHGVVIDNEFTADVTVTCRFPRHLLPKFQASLKELSHGKIHIVIIKEEESTILPLKEADEV